MSLLFSSLIIRFIRMDLELRVLGKKGEKKDKTKTLHASYNQEVEDWQIIPYLKPKMTILEQSLGHSQTVRYRSL